MQRGDRPPFPSLLSFFPATWIPLLVIIPTLQPIIVPNVSGRNDLIGRGLSVRSKLCWFYTLSFWNLSSSQHRNTGENKNDKVRNKGKLELSFDFELSNFCFECLYDFANVACLVSFTTVLVLLNVPQQNEMYERECLWCVRVSIQ